MNNLKQKLENVLYGLVVCSFVVPLIVFPASFIFPFIVPKVLAFRIISVCIFAVYLLLLLGNTQRYRLRFTLLTTVVALFLGSFTLSTFIGVDWYKSMWDNHERMLGLFTVAHSILYYAVLTSVFKKWADWKWLLRAFLFAGTLVMFIGLLQKGSPELLLNRGAARVS